MPRPYEAVYIIDSSLEDGVIAEKLERFHEILGVKETVQLNLWGRRQLAYPIGSKDTGYYAVARFDAEPTALPEYERVIGLDDGVVRHMLTLHEHELGAPDLGEDEIAARRRDEDDEDED